MLNTVYKSYGDEKIVNKTHQIHPWLRHFSAIGVDTYFDVAYLTVGFLTHLPHQFL
ncbi:hypothetical protein MKW92_002623, partial [Papaver armeniacum]